MKKINNMNELRWQMQQLVLEQYRLEKAIEQDWQELKFRLSVKRFLPGELIATVGRSWIEKRIRRTFEQYLLAAGEKIGTKIYSWFK